MSKRVAKRAGDKGGRGKKPRGGAAGADAAADAEAGFFLLDDDDKQQQRQQQAEEESDDEEARETAEEKRLRLGECFGCCLSSRQVHSPPAVRRSTHSPALNSLTIYRSY